MRKTRTGKILPVVGAEVVRVGERFLFRLDKV